MSGWASPSAVARSKVEANAGGAVAAEGKLSASLVRLARTWVEQSALDWTVGAFWDRDRVGKVESRSVDSKSSDGFKKFSHSLIS